MLKSINESDLQNYVGKHVEECQLKDILDTYIYIKVEAYKHPVRGILMFYTKEPSSDVKVYLDMGCVVLYNDSIEASQDEGYDE